MGITIPPVKYAPPGDRFPIVRVPADQLSFGCLELSANEEPQSFYTILKPPL